MKLKKIRTFFKNTLLIALSFIVMVGVTGFSYQAHYCHDKLSGIALYPELGFRQSISCGCAFEANSINSHPKSNSPVLTKNSCCSNVSFFSKLEIETCYTDFTTYFSVLPAITAININFTVPAISPIEDLSITDAGFQPYPLAGRKLVLFLSQQRIPLISYNC